MSCKEQVYAILSWFSREGRRLPFRQEYPDPYRIWVSEVMLQQTRISTVLPYRTRFFLRFPSVYDLAQASLEEILELWAGLGYYRRAENLWKGAKYIWNTWKGCFPQEEKLLRQIPGVGPYISSAIRVFAWGLPAAPLDGNIRRFFQRFLGISESAPLREAEKTMREHFLKWEQISENARAVVYAVMDLGARICVPGKPRCDFCPVRKHCRSRNANAPQFFTARQKKSPAPRVVMNLAWIEEQGRILLVRRKQGIWRHLWSLPETSCSTCPIHTEYEHILTHRRLWLRIRKCQARCTFQQGAESRWIDWEALKGKISAGKLAIPVGIQKGIYKVFQNPNSE